MKYIKDSQGQVHGFDDTDPAQIALMEKMFFTNGTLNTGCTDVSASWPPAITLAEAQATQNVILAAACQSAIESGFTSSALGAAHTYGCKATDQANVNLAAINGNSLWCADSTGAWSFIAHTAAQAQQVQKDMAAHIQAEQGHYAQQLVAVAAAATVSAVQVVVW